LVGKQLIDGDKVRKYLSKRYLIIAEESPPTFKGHSFEMEKSMAMAEKRHGCASG